MKKGTVKFYNEAKGYGFIIDSETQSEIFFHATGIIKGGGNSERVRQDSVVSFNVKDGKKGLNAIDISVI
jgi:CspA family cold shock protein